MKIFTSAIEGVKLNINGQNVYFAEWYKNKGGEIKWVLVSYYYLRNHIQNAVFLRNNCELMLVDSGAHSFQFGKKVNWVEYTKEYADFIKWFDQPNVIGYFEMDIENIVGYEKVLELRKILESASSKIIPVWHPLRGINDYEEMCKQYSGKIIAIGGFKGTDIKDAQYLMFLKVAKKYNCKVHCLGMSRTEVLKKIPFDFTDSATWITATNMGHPMINEKQSNKVRFARAKGLDKFFQLKYNYEQFVKMQNKYYLYWKKECKD